MPPRKKSTADGAAPAAPTRTSARSKAAQEAKAAAGPASNGDDQVPATKKPASKRKRTTAASDDEDGASKAKKPASKKAKKSEETIDEEDKADGMDVDEEEKPKATKPASKKPASKKPASKKAKAKAEEEEEEEAEEEEKTEEKKMVTVIKRGAAPVDPSSGKVNTHQVYANDEGVWDATLNQTDVKDNKNKFYNLQLLHPINQTTNIILFTHWGRVGENGQSQVKGPFAPAAAVAAFKAQFKQKAGVNWEDRVGMVAKKGKYTWLERDYDDEEANEGSSKPKSSKKEGKAKEARPIPDSALSPEVQDFCRLIFDTGIINATLSSLNYDANKLPLGKLAKSTITKGFEALKSLSEVIDNNDATLVQRYGTKAKACEELTNLYYSIIPHSFGRNRPIIINNSELLKNELDLVNTLTDMEIASELMQQIEEKEEQDPVNPLDAQFNSLDLTNMEALAPGGQEFKTIEEYVRDSQGHTHSHIKGRVQHVFRVERGAETEAWKKGGFDKVEDGERMLLWHGSRSTNFAGILKQGLRIAPPEAPVNGYMFGKGVYFADIYSKSAGYCYPWLSNDTGVLLLCEVAAKPFYELHDAQYNANENCKKAGKRATKGIGKSQPQKWKDAGKALGVEELKGCHMPDGKPAQVDTPGYLQYNEYIVYDIAQIRVKYLLMVKM
ncbi:hypothetical protein AAF712_007283 [Marasmius tenuissimus]|uniref:Poly [ADP-ribose] polymerase n=1 Tax=Marasmius tenuissimus TaxID=585030 RepID=A0ABR2ZVD2_9AGAR